MKKKLNCILLIDDSSDDNFFHAREIKKANSNLIIVTKSSGIQGLEYLMSKNDPHSDLIFLDINMPGMNGWDFLEEYSKLDKDLQGKAIIIMLTTSDNLVDLEKAKAWSVVSDYITKPLTKEKLKDITEKHFG